MVKLWDLTLLSDSDPEKFMFVSALKRDNELARRQANVGNTEDLEATDETDDTDDILERERQEWGDD